MKESAIDCELYKHNSDENLVCYGFGKVSSNQYSSYPSFEKDLTEKEGDEVKEINWTPIKLTIQNIDYAYNEKTRELYDYRSYEDAITGNGELLYIGKLVRHNNNYKTAYAHLKSFKKGISKGIRVNQGDIIGYVGSTGKSTGPHLHYEIIYNNKQINQMKMKISFGKILKEKELDRFNKELNIIYAKHLFALYE